MRVVRYDRAGLGHSDECTTPRDPETVAKELHLLLEKAGESPPYLLMGHSIGGPYIRVFTELYPDEVMGMVFLDATHPDHIARYNAPKKTDFKYKGYLWTIKDQAFLSDIGILPVYDKLVGTPYYGPGLPDEINHNFKEVLYNGKSFRGYAKEMEHYYDILERSGQVEDFGSLPILAFNAISEDPGQRQKDSEKFDSIRNLGNHKEYAELSTNGKYIAIPGNHLSIFTKKENAAIICGEVMCLLEEYRIDS
jgi:pimeloyl-ACP methyl ester carboxylesterase